MGSTDYARTVLITGAAQRIGRAIALRLAREGYHVLLHYFNSGEAAQHTAEEIRESGGTCDLYQADLRDELAIKTMLENIQHACGGLDVLINNASIFSESRLEDTDPNLWDEIFDVNVRAAWLCAKFARPLLWQQSGCIIHLLDSGIEKIWPKYAAYQISKVAQAQLTKIMAKTYAPRIRVNGIAPGLILPAEDTSETEWRSLVQQLPLQRQGTPADLEEAVLFLIQQPYITGEILFIDGGYRLR